ncbi:MAG TPA: cobaltochelatase subunit CobN [Methanoregulaceae archaeon]|nr:cobaltochelatase subunit CobN [Methanoregulaceae archaeon]HQJ88284.1 cobaltochelatase subunit CobN [Methanoregulaceae archaeon]
MDIDTPGEAGAGRPTRVSAVLWANELPLLSRVSSESGVVLEGWFPHDLLDADRLAACLASFRRADVILLHPSTGGGWDEVRAALPPGIPVVIFGTDPAHLATATVPPAVNARANAYITYGGPDNYKELLRYLESAVLGRGGDARPPAPTPWEACYHPDADRTFSSTGDYLAWRPRRHDQAIGLLFYRTYWSSRNLDLVDALVRAFEERFDVIPVFSTGTGDASTGAKPGDRVIEEFLAGRVDGLVDLQAVTLGDGPDDIVTVLRHLGIPVFHPLILYNRTEEDWIASMDGMTAGEIAWGVIMPEFQGMIEMLPVGALGEGGRQVPIAGRVFRFVARVARWLALARIPPSEKRVAFVLNNGPCAGLEATIGTAAHLDALESLALLLSDLRDQGYRVEVPDSGEALIREITGRRAHSEFRWTTVEEIVRSGGALAELDPGEYARWFGELPREAREQVVRAWGEPPGVPQDGVPVPMLHNGRMVITGLSLGNAVVCTQPKRGCAGSRCDGTACRILHDPTLPPSHHYLATYWYLDRVFGADVIVHVGTHGSLEFLPGKGIALSDRDFPDAVVGTVPFLYLYNSDNPAEGTVAKRRACATLVDHLQTSMVAGGLYGDLQLLNERIGEYLRLKEVEPARAHAAGHLVGELLEKTGLGEEIRREPAFRDADLDGLIPEVQARLARLSATWVPDGMHVFGTIPDGEREAALITAVLRYDGRLRRVLLAMMGLEPTVSDAEVALIELLDRMGVSFVRGVLDGRTPAEAGALALGDRLVVPEPPGTDDVLGQIRDIARRLEASDEVGALLAAMDGGYVEPGPAGLVTRGRPDILPSGRNFYPVDPRLIPSESAWRVGRRLADLLLERHRGEHGTYPENVAVYWQASDVMWSDGEQLSQLLHLIGVEPVWREGRFDRVEVVPLARLGRPRIDITVRVSGILRDAFPGCIDLLDDAVRRVAALDEPVEMNYLRRHTPGESPRPRIFGSQPGTYGMGVNLAIYASAWNDTKDLADLFVAWNGYAYGRNLPGREAQAALVEQLRTVQATFNKTSSDEYDLLGCCCYFGAHGGITAAARTFGGHGVVAYFGDTRDPDRVEVRGLAEEIGRVARSRLLNPRWIAGQEAHGYAGAAEIAKRIGRVYGWEATTGEVGDALFNGIAETFLLDGTRREFFREKNPWALEEVGRRLLEAQERGLWNPPPELLEEVREAYLEVEGWLEGRIDGTAGERQGGTIGPPPDELLARWRDVVERTGYRPHGEGSR